MRRCGAEEDATAETKESEAEAADTAPEGAGEEAKAAAEPPPGRVARCRGRLAEEAAKEAEPDDAANKAEAP